jgi:hypothetical protein
LDRLGIGRESLAIGCIGDDCVSLNVLGVIDGRNLGARYIGLGLSLVLDYFVESWALGLGLVIGAGGRRWVLKRTLGRLQVGRRCGHFDKSVLLFSSLTSECSERCQE